MQMEKNNKIKEFSQFGGPLYRLGERLGLVRGGTNTVALGLVLGIFLWCVLVLLALAEGVANQLFSLSVIGGHLRLLVVIPLLFLSESWVYPRMTEFISMIVRSGVVPERSLPVLKFEIARTAKWKDSWLPEGICLIVAISLPWIGANWVFPGATLTNINYALQDVYWTGKWYWLVCLTIFRFLVIRWLWKLGLWCYILWRISRLQLHLLATHPDRTAGLRGAEVVQFHFIPLVFAISVVQSASLAEGISVGTTTIESIYPVLLLTVFIDAVLFIGPLFIFVFKLWDCKVKGFGEYTVLATRYVRDFDKKWVEGEPGKEPLLGSQDIQALADLNGSYSTVLNMSIVPASGKLFFYLGLAALLPFIPLLLSMFSVSEIAGKAFQILFGL